MARVSHGQNGQSWVRPRPGVRRLGSARRLFALLLVLGLALLLPAAADPSPDAIQALAKAYEEEGSFRGTVLVSKGGSTLATFACGYRDTACTVRNDLDTIYYIGSMSKTFCAALVLQVVDEGKLDLDARLASFAPGIEGAGEISVRNLLNHSSGLQSWEGVMDMRGRKNLVPADVVAFLGNWSPKFKAGTMCAYSNSNYELLAFILEKVRGKPYADILREGIIVPLGLSRTGFGLLPESDPRLATNLLYYQLEREISPWKGGCSPSGSMYSTALDLDRFARALVEGRVVSRKSFDLMRTATISNGELEAGYGLWIWPDGTMGHGGIIGGYNSIFLLDPKRDLSIVILGSSWIHLSGSYKNQLIPAIYEALGIP